MIDCIWRHMDALEAVYAAVLLEVTDTFLTLCVPHRF